MVTVGLLRRYWNYTQNSLRTPNWYWHNILSLCNMVPCIRCWIKTLHPRLNDDNSTAASAGYACILHSQIEINRRFLCTQHPIITSHAALPTACTHCDWVLSWRIRRMPQTGMWNQIASTRMGGLFNSTRKKIKELLPNYIVVRPTDFQGASVVVEERNSQERRISYHLINIELPWSSSKVYLRNN